MLLQFCIVPHFLFFEILSPDTDSKMKLNDNGFNEQKNQLNKQILRSEVLEPKNINMVDELQPEDTSDYLFSLAPDKKLNCFRFKSKFINSLTTFFFIIHVLIKWNSNLVNRPKIDSRNVPIIDRCLVPYRCGYGQTSLNQIFKIVNMNVY